MAATTKKYLLYFPGLYWATLNLVTTTNTPVLGVPDINGTSQVVGGRGINQLRLRPAKWLNPQKQLS